MFTDGSSSSCRSELARLSAYSMQAASPHQSDRSHKEDGRLCNGMCSNNGDAFMIEKTGTVGILVR